MGVKKLRGKKKKGGKKKGKRKKKRDDDDTSGLTLPTEMKEAVTEFGQYTSLFYGEPKVGKSTVAGTFPDALFFAFEPGTKGMEIYEFNADGGGCRNWEIARKGVSLLEKTDDFQTVVFDTVERAYDMCLDWVCENRGIEYPGNDAFGEQDFGKSWRAVRQEFMDIIHRILFTGRGIIFTSHAKTAEHKVKSTGEKYTRIYPTMSNQARKTVEALVDFFFFADYIRSKDGNIERVFVTQGDETIWAGCRKGVAPFPQFVPMYADDGYSTLLAAFQGDKKDVHGRPVGLNPNQLRIGKQTSGPARELVRKKKEDKKGKKKSKVKKKKR